jgi:hypothetical protein
MFVADVTINAMSNLDLRHFLPYRPNRIATAVSQEFRSVERPAPCSNAHASRTGQDKIDLARVAEDGSSDPVTFSDTRALILPVSPAIDERGGFAATPQFNLPPASTISRVPACVAALQATATPIPKVVVPHSFWALS